MDPDKEKEDKEKEAKKRDQIAKVKYIEEREMLQKRSCTSFGKVILSDEKTYPMYSFGGANRFAITGDIITIAKDTPGPRYTPANEEFYKYKYSPKWKIGDSKRPPLHTGERFEHYNHLYNDKEDLSKLQKKWNRTVGGAMSLDPRIRFDFREGVPGPGRYQPDIKCVRPKSPAYVLGERTQSNSLKLLIGTSENVDPWTYHVEDCKKTSIHKEPPKWTLGKDERKGLKNRIWTKNETYYLYSCVGDQIMTHKNTEPIISMGKSTREKNKKLGMFPSMMSKQPSKIRIEHPKF